MLKELSEAPGVSGYEREVRKIIRRYVEPYAVIEQDRLGSIIAKRTGRSDRPRIMLAGHMDEIGFMIPYQTDFMEGGAADTGRIHLHGSGVPSIVIEVPSRYIHSHASLINRDDYDHAVRLVTEVVKRLDDATVADLVS